MALIAASIVRASIPELYNRRMATVVAVMRLRFLVPDVVPTISNNGLSHEFLVVDAQARLSLVKDAVVAPTVRAVLGALLKTTGELGKCILLQVQ